MPVHDGEIGQGYAPVTLAVQGGIPPYSWAVGTGALPGGLSLSASGVISGQVTAAGAFKFNVAVADSGGSQATKATVITVYKALAVKGVCVQLCVIGQGCAKCGSFGTVSNGAPPYSYQTTAGAVPKGMTLSGVGLKGGFPAGNYALTVQVTDKLGVKASVSANWSIYSPAKVTAGSTCINLGNPPSCATTGWSYSGGNPTVAPKVAILRYSQYCDANGQCYTVPNIPPQGWSVSVKSGSITFSGGGLACTPNVPYGAVITVALIDPSGCPTTSQSNQANLTVFLENNC